MKKRACLSLLTICLSAFSFGQKTFTNPIIPGFFPDPSTIRVGDDFYTINSTFQYFPAIVISHSKDLVNWRQIDYVFKRNEELDLTHFYDGCGIWAPDLSYHNGEFYVFYCLVQLKKDRSVNVRGNYMVKSKSIHGPWSKPVQLTDHGSDPSHFVDSDGQHYMLYAAGIPTGNGTKIVRLNDECTKVIDGPFWMETDGKKSAPEGPHLLKKDGYYYFMMAASAGAFNGHHQLLARSRNVYGPYESYPGNPFCAQLNPLAINHHLGHGKMFNTQNGEWYITLISQRWEKGKNFFGRDSNISQLGRETSLYRVEWTPDGWAKTYGKDGAPDTSSCPHLPWTPIKTEQSDEFGTDRLPIQWLCVRNPVEADYSLKERKGYLRIYTGNLGLDTIGARNIFLQRETHLHYSAMLKMEFSPRTTEHAGLLCYYDTKGYASLSVRKASSGRVVVLEECRVGHKKTIRTTSIPDKGAVYLKVTVDRLRRNFFISSDQKRWTPAGEIANAEFLSDQGTPQWGFTGTMVGVYALNYGSGNRLAADFDWFRIVNR